MRVHACPRARRTLPDLRANTTQRDQVRTTAGRDRLIYTWEEKKKEKKTIGDECVRMYTRGEETKARGLGGKKRKKKGGESIRRGRKESD